MSMYRLLRASAITTLLVKYRARLFRVALAAAFALVTAWSYGDVASFLETRHPDMLWLALVVKNVVIYSALFYAFWQFRPVVDDASAEASSEETRSNTKGPTPVEEAGFERLDSLGDLQQNPKLKSRKQAILEKDR